MPEAKADLVKYENVSLETSSNTLKQKTDV